MLILDKLGKVKWPISLLRLDPRYYQATVLAGLLAYGLVFLQFDVTLISIVFTLGTGLVSQWIATKVWKLSRYDPKSALISGLSLCLLLRSNDPALNSLAAAIAIFSKFLLRSRAKHIFNPTNFALVIMWLIFGRNVWISPGQWGHAAFLGFLIACLGSFVVNRAYRSDVTWAFIGIYLAIVFGRASWLGDSWWIPLHMVSNGGLILFAFYMISDPKTTPNSRAGRILFAFMVAAVAGMIQFGLYNSRGLYIALFAVSFATPFLEKLYRTENRAQLGPELSLAPDKSTAQPAVRGRECLGAIAQNPISQRRC